MNERLFPKITSNVMNSGLVKNIKLCSLILITILSSCNHTDKYILDEQWYPIPLVESPSSKSWDTVIVDIVHYPYLPQGDIWATEQRVWEQSSGEYLVFDPVIEDNVQKIVLNKEEADSARVAFIKQITRE